MTSALAAQFRRHFAHRDHLYGVLLEDLADDLESGGVTAEICRDHLDATRADVIQLRLLAGLFRIVLRGDAPDLVPFYPCLDGREHADNAWPVVRQVLASHVEELRSALVLPPQTNEVGRSACLVIGLFEAVRRFGRTRVRVLEPGASAGLNLNVDHYRFFGPDWAWGGDSPLDLDTGSVGVRPVEFEIVERRGCDLSPVDVTTEKGADYLTSFVWPFDLVRHERLAAAIGVARQHPVAVDKAPASAWISEQLDRPVDPEVLTVVWQSITRQYWPAEESAAVDHAIGQARHRMPIAHLTMEGVPPIQGTDSYAIAQHGPQLMFDGDELARSHHHGPPVVLV